MNKKKTKKKGINNIYTFTNDNTSDNTIQYVDEHRMPMRQCDNIVRGEEDDLSLF